jgi:hypothetical protein
MTKTSRGGRKAAKWKIKIGPRWRWMNTDEVLQAIRTIAARKLGRRISTSKHRSEPFDY